MSVRLPLLTVLLAAASAWLPASAVSSSPPPSTTLTIEIAATGGATGAVTGTGGIDCAGPPATGACTMSSSSPQGFLRATPGPGSVFAGWSGMDLMFIPEDNCGGLINPCMVWLSGMGDRTVTANFAPADPPEDGPMCMFEPWLCPDQHEHAAPAPAVAAAPAPSTARSSVERCGKGKARKGSRCVRRRALARQACGRSRSKAQRRRCLSRKRRAAARPGRAARVSLGVGHAAPASQIPGGYSGSRRRK